MAEKWKYRGISGIVARWRRAIERVFYLSFSHISAFSKPLWLKISINIHLSVEPYVLQLIFLEYFSHTTGDKGCLWLKSLRQIAEN